MAIRVGGRRLYHAPGCSGLVADGGAAASWSRMKPDRPANAASSRTNWDLARPWLAAAVLIALVAFVYAPTLANGFIWDDDLYVQNNLAIRTPSGLRDVWTRLDAFPQYYPLVQTSFWIEYQLWELDPRGYHATNLALHAIATVLLWRLLSRLAVPGAWLAAAVFGVHPVHVESVAWVTERKNVLSLVFALGSLLAYLRASPLGAPAGVRPSGASWYLLSLASYVAALLSKTVTASVPAVLLVAYWWKRGRVTGRDATWLAPFFAVGLALSSVTVWMERTHVGAVGPEWQLSFVERVLIAGRAAWFYAGKLFWPHPLAFFYPRWTIDAHQGWQFVFPVAAVLVIVALWMTRQRIGRGALAAVLVFLGVLTPALGFFDVYPFRYSFVADHFQYHASIGVIAGAVAFGTLCHRRLGRRARLAALLVAAVLVAALGVLSRQQTRCYRDLPTLYESVIAVNPSSWAAHNNLGRSLQNQSRYEEAVVQFQQAISLGPHYARIRNNLGSALSSLGRLEEAEAELTRALAGEGDATDQADTRVYLGVVLIKQNRFAEAAVELRAALQLRPRDPWALYNLGVAQGGAGDLAAGAASIRESLAIDPTSANAHHELGSMQRAAGDAAGALASYAEAVQLEPDSSEFSIDLGSVLLETGDLDGAERNLRKALELDPRSADAHAGLGILLAARGDLDGAQAEFESALRADPNDARAIENLRRVREASSQSRRR